MSVRLISRQRSIPYGYRFFQPEINWSAPRGASFHRIVVELIEARKGNPAMLQRHKWSLEYDAVANEVDEYNAAICLNHGWKDFISEPRAIAIPKPQPQHQAQVVQSLKDAAARAKELVAGAKTLIEWIDSGEGAVQAVEAERRAAICATCPKNEAGDFTTWFTIPAAELIKRQVQRAQERKLSTSQDEKLNLCTACHCPLKLKVHVPLDWIKKRLTAGQMERLKQAPNCWIIKAG